MTEEMRDTLVLGAGVVGLSAALYLRRSGIAVTVLDPLGPAGGASFGNAGMLSPETAVPIALPGMLREVPRWLTDPLGPLAVRLARLPRAAPWLARWLLASRLSRVLEISDAMRALHRRSLECWQELLGPESFRELVRPSGHLQIWEGEAKGATAALEQRLRERHGIRAEPLGADELRQLVPGIARSVRHGLLVPANGFTANPQRIVAALAERFLHEGGEIVRERAMKLLPRASPGGFTVMTNLANREAARLVVAAGAWSRELLDPLGVKTALETERGYHAMLPAPSITPRLPISNKSRGFALTPMEHGLRVAGTVEIAGLAAPPDERRAAVLVQHAKRLFPDLVHGEPSFWMGFRPSTPDSLPVLGAVANRPGLFLDFGHGHFGMTGGPPSGRLLAALVSGRTPEIDPAPYAPTRFGR